MAIWDRIKLKESRPVGRVRVLDNGKEVHSSSEYRFAAEWTQATYNLSDAEMRSLYAFYKDDYDSI